MMHRYVKRAFCATMLALSACSSVDIAPDAHDASADICGASDPCHIYSSADGGCAVVGNGTGSPCGKDHVCSDGECRPFCTHDADCAVLSGICRTVHCDPTFVNGIPESPVLGCYTLAEPTGTPCDGGVCKGGGCS